MFKENFVIKGELVCETGLHIGGSNDNIDIGGTDNVTYCSIFLWMIPRN